MPTWIPRSQSIEDMIGEILSAQNSPSAQWARRDAAAENETALNNEDYRKRRLLEMGETGATTRTGMTVAGNADVENIRNIGEMSRLGLKGFQALEQGKQIGEYGLEGHKMTSGATITASENRLAGDTRRAEATENAAAIGVEGKTDARAKLLETWAGGMNPTLESLNVVMAGYDKLYPPKKAEVVSPAAIAPTGNDKETFYSSSVGQPVTNPSTTQARKSLTGGQSMEFRAEGTMSAEEKERRKKESENRLFYGTKFNR